MTPPHDTPDNTGEGMMEESFGEWAFERAQRLVDKFMAQGLTVSKPQFNMIAFALLSARKKGEAEIGSLKAARKNDAMFFQVIADALEVDPSCEPGMLDPMCTAEAVRALRARLSETQERIEKIREAAKEKSLSDLSFRIVVLALLAPEAVTEKDVEWAKQQIKALLSITTASSSGRGRSSETGGKRP